MRTHHTHTRARARTRAQARAYTRNSEGPEHTHTHAACAATFAWTHTHTHTHTTTQKPLCIHLSGPSLSPFLLPLPFYLAPLPSRPARSVSLTQTQTRSTMLTHYPSQ